MSNETDKLIADHGVSNNSVLVFGELFEYLRHHGFLIGIDEYQRLQVILNRVGSSHGTEDLKTLICPLVATGKEQQAQFYKLFDEYFALHILPDTPPPEKTSSAKYIYTLITALLLVLGISLFALITFWRTTPPTPTPTPTPIANTNDNVNTSPVNSNGTDNSNGVGTNLNKPIITPQTTVGNQITPVNRIVNTLGGTPTPTPPIDKKRKDFADSLQLAAILAAVFLLLIYQAYRYDRRRNERGRQDEIDPPFRYEIEIDWAKPKIYNFDNFYAAARLLRRRQIGEFKRIDVKATIKATINALGYPSIHYKTDTKLPEYLILIDRATNNDHQAHLFDELAQVLKQEDIFVTRYFYDADARLCYDEKNNGRTLPELQSDFKQHRLLIFGDGERFADPLTGELLDWTNIFSDWTDCFLFTPVYPDDWGQNEISLSTRFVIFPATVEGLMAIARHFETPLRTNLQHWLRDNTTMPPSFPQNVDGDDIIPELRKYLGKELFEWLCACAVHRELSWDLTLFLGSQPFMGENLLSEENLLRLVRLPSLRSGAIPDNLRQQLIQELEKNEEKAQSVRAALLKLLEKNKPPEGTFAANSYKLFLNLQKWLLDRSDADKLKKLLRTMKQLTKAEVIQDAALIPLLEKAPKWGYEKFLPTSLRKSIFRNGIPGLGLKAGIISLMILLAASVAWLAAPSVAKALISPNETPTPTPIPTPTPAPAPTPTPTQATNADNQKPKLPGNDANTKPSATKTAVPTPKKPSDDKMDPQPGSSVTPDSVGVQLINKFKSKKNALGVDVSKFSTVKNWKELKDAGLSFVIMRATQGTARSDDKFPEYWEKSKEYGFIRGAYHFYEPNQDPTQQALFFVNSVDLERTDLPLILDVENPLNGSISDAKTFIENLKICLEVIAQKTGRKPIIYTWNNFVRTLDMTENFSEYPLWIADYSNKDEPTVPGNWNKWTFRQFSDGTINNPNILKKASGVDYNTFNGTEKALEDFIKNQ
ncbi:MAG: GH25 family lysozyme [Pyrinomonadaceae bacterium]